MGKQINKQERQHKNSLFREEVLHEQKNPTLGAVVVISPVTFAVWAYGLFTLALVVGLFICFGEYTSRYEVHGVLVPEKSLLNVYASKSGVIQELFVKQGDKIEKGQLLYLISTEQHRYSEQSHASQQIESLEKQVLVQKTRIEILKRTYERFKELFERKLVPESVYLGHHDNYLSAIQSLHNLQFKINEIQGSRSFAIRSPSTGTVSSITASLGEQIEQDKVLASIIPEDAKLQGVLYIPTEAIGFVKKGQRALLKYRAFPYQQFGLHDATIFRIDNSTLYPSDIKPLVNVNAPFYRVLVVLKKQTVDAYGRQELLLPGMLFEATILSEKRKIWQWIMAPVYNLRGHLL